MNKRDRIVDGIVLVVVILVVGLLFYLQHKQRPTQEEEESKPEEQAQVAESCPPLSGYALKIAALAVYVTHNGYIVYEEEAGEEISLDEAREFAQDLSCADQKAALEVGNALVSYADALSSAQVNTEGVIPDDKAGDAAEAIVGRLDGGKVVVLMRELGLSGGITYTQAKELLVNYMTNNEQTIKEAVEAAKHD